MKLSFRDNFGLLWIFIMIIVVLGDKQSFVAGDLPNLRSRKGNARDGAPTFPPESEGFMLYP